MHYKKWLRDYVKKYNEEHCKSEPIIIKKNTKKIIPMNNKCSFNVGYLFLKKLYYQLSLSFFAYLYYKINYSLKLRTFPLS